MKQSTRSFNVVKEEVEISVPEDNDVTSSST
ncbi:hypothetical protein RIR_e31180_A0A2N1NYF3_9GLOM [Rhizophagus irregularis DAOM 181602=DAOM 197198]|nr:hypothetical protein RIR_e31180_A0A2N1NYF3_9GLOM [Rhizophagus irregularis DAOM 181602=DAOM 197198]